MKKYYTTFSLMLISCFGFSQNYELGIVHVSNYDFKVVAVPDFTSSGNTDISDVGFTLVLPAGLVDVANVTAALPGRTVTVQEFDATFLTGQGLGDNTKDVFQFNMPPGQSLVAHTSGQQIDLFNFQITNMPTTDQMFFLLNSDPIATGSGGVLDSFYNSNIDATATQDYFSMPAPGLDSFMFNTLSFLVIQNNTFETKVYPNPSSDTITIKATQDIKNIELYNLQGKLVITTKKKNIKINYLNSGMYLLRIETERGVITKRIVKD